MSNIKIMSLGGLGENGKNMTVVEVNNKIFKVFLFHMVMKKMLVQLLIY